MADLSEVPTSVLLQRLPTRRLCSLPSDPAAPRPVLTFADVQWADTLIQHDYNPEMSPIPGCADTEEESCAESETTETSEPNSVNNSFSDDSCCSPLISSFPSPNSIRLASLDDDRHRKALSPPFKPSVHARFPQRSLMHRPEPKMHHQHHQHHGRQQHQQHQQHHIPLQQQPQQHQHQQHQHQILAQAAAQANLNRHAAYQRHGQVMAYDPQDRSSVSGHHASGVPTPPPHVAVVLSPPPEAPSYLNDLHIEPLSLPQPASPLQPVHEMQYAHAQPIQKHGAPTYANVMPISSQAAFPATPAGLLSASRSLAMANSQPPQRVPATKKRGNKRAQVSKAQSTGKPRRFCHICRSPKDLDRIVFCASKKQSHVFCSGCVGRRLGLSFDELVLDQTWMCPKCEGHCPCSKCRKRYPLDQAAANPGNGFAQARK